MKFKQLLKYLTVKELPMVHKELEVKIFDHNKEYIGDITNITVERHVDKTYIMINVKLEDLKQY